MWIRSGSNWIANHGGLDSRDSPTCNVCQEWLERSGRAKKPVHVTLKGAVQFSNYVFSFLFCYVFFAAKYTCTNILTCLQHYRVAVFA